MVLEIPWNTKHQTDLSVHSCKHFIFDSQNFYRKYHLEFILWNHVFPHVFNILFHIYCSLHVFLCMFVFTYTCQKTTLSLFSLLLPCELRVSSSRCQTSQKSNYYLNQLTIRNFIILFINFMCYLEWN